MPRHAERRGGVPASISANVLYTGPGDVVGHAGLSPTERYLSEGKNSTAYAYLRPRDYGWSLTNGSGYS